MGCLKWSAKTFSISRVCFVHPLIVKCRSWLLSRRTNMFLNHPPEPCSESLSAGLNYSQFLLPCLLPQPTALSTSHHVAYCLNGLVDKTARILSKLLSHFSMNSCWKTTLSYQRNETNNFAVCRYDSECPVL